MMQSLRSPKDILLLAVAAAALGCAAQERPPAGAEHALRAAPDGDLTVDKPGSYVNTYALLNADANKGDKSISIFLEGEFASFSVKKGDLILIIQMQGAVIDTSDTASFGEVTDLDRAGLYEFARVESYDANTRVIQLEAACGGLRNSYSIYGKTQVLRVPQYATLRITPSGTIIAPPWDNRKGGVVALSARTLQINGAIEVSGLGFRGGRADRMSGGGGTDQPAYRGDTGTGGEKGEGIADDSLDSTRRHGRGAPANGGGGGNSHKAGGGGGANAGNLALWTGQGVMDGTATGAAAWMLDPAYKGALSTSSGGGRGGYSYSAAGRNPTTVGPGDPTWGGNQRRERGGLGGRPLPATPAARLFLGGGGGAGDAGSVGSEGGNGGNGGGLVIVLSDSVSGSGRISANGQAGFPPGLPDYTAGAGGGGGGGSVALATAALAGVSIEARGGGGGSQLSSAYLSGNDELEGPGGGGGGGLVALPSGLGGQVLITGGAGGTSQGRAAAAFPPNGATQGGTGMGPVPFALSEVPACNPADLAITVTNGQTVLSPGQPLTYTVKVVNNGPSDVTGAIVTSTLTPASPMSWTCAAGAGGSCQSAQGSGELSTRVTLQQGASATFTVSTNTPTASTLRYRVQVQPPPEVTDPTLANNAAEDVDASDLSADLTIQGQALSPVRDLGSVTTTHVYKVRNQGPRDASAIKLQLDLREGATLREVPSGEGWTCAARVGGATCQRQALRLGESSDVRLPLSAEQSATSVVTSGSVTSDVTDPAPGNNQVTVAQDIPQERPMLAGGGFGCAIGKPGGPRGRDGRDGRDAGAGAGALGALVVLGALVRARRRRQAPRLALLAAACGASVVGLSGSARAQDHRGFQVNRYEPTAAGEFSLAVDHPWYSGTRLIAAGLTFNYGHNPLVFGLRGQDGSFTQQGAVLEHQLLMHVDLAGSFLDRVLFTASLPVMLLERGTPAYGVAALQGAGVGDPRFGVMARIWGQPYKDAFSVSAGLHLWVPVSQDSGAFPQQLGESGIRVMPKIAMGGLTHKVLWSFTGAFYYRPDQSIGTLPTGSGNTVGPEVNFGAAVAYADMERGFAVGPEALLSTVVTGGNGFKQDYTSLELLLGAHYNIKQMFQVGLGGGVGLLREPGTPDGRVLLRLAYAPGRKKEAPKVVDRDGDGIEDMPDRCPDEPAGKMPDPKNPGCPLRDKDGDGVFDNEDQCLEEPAGKNADPAKPGCPLLDKDGDGVFDNEDQCLDVPRGEHPDEARPGCPLTDKDGDGVFDNEDQCLDVPAGARPDPGRKGCPDVDTDGDGVFDSKDACKTVPQGIQPDPQRPGCPAPDRDGDSVPDAVDACPDKAGAPSPVAKKNGCPGLVEVKTGQIVILKQVFFANNKDTIQKKSFPVLQAVADVLKTTPLILKVGIEGHTDNKGKEEANIQLSDRRAQSVMRWLIANGVAADRLTAKGYGPTRPIADNKTNKGRAANRRVDFRILDPAQPEPAKEPAKQSP
jgi:uncharacterized repeat protein (TIGR01451 family)